MELTLEITRTARQLLMFESVIRHRSVGAGAAELDLTPEEVSQSLRRLEETMGTNLFTRNGGAIGLSSTGEVLFLAVSAGIAELHRRASCHHHPDLMRSDGPHPPHRTTSSVVDMA